MKTLLICLCLVLSFYQSPAQSHGNETGRSFFLSPEFHLGKTIDANTDFPDTKLQTGILLSVGWYNNNPEKEWATRLNYPKTGLILGYIDFGNSEKVGQAISLLPFIETRVLKRVSLNVGMGFSYMNTLYDPGTNPLNEAVTTNLNWSFRSFLYYDLVTAEKTDLRMGLGYFHHSNGHRRLPNQGLNSLLASISANFHLNGSPEAVDRKKKENNSRSYFIGRIGVGENVLSEKINDRKGVYTLAFEMGKIINKTFKLGGGFYVRHYQHYFDYIRNDGELVSEMYPVFQENPFGYASNFGVFGTAELLLGHVGFEFDLGLNIYKPFYKVDWMLNQGYSYINSQDELVEVLGELDWYYEIKRTVSSRLGLKYYLFNINNSKKHNFYLGAHINANLGQADFSDLSLGYLFLFDKSR